MGRVPSREALEHDHQEPEFLIAAARAAGRAHHTLKHDDAFAVIDTHGDISALGATAGGLFHKDTRYLSRLELQIAGSSPLLLGSTLDDADLQLCCDLTNPDIFRNGALWLHKDCIHIYRTSFVRDATLQQRLLFTNHSNLDIEVDVTLLFDCDFADIFEVRGMRREKRGNLVRSVVSPQNADFEYTGLDRAIRRTTVRLEPPPITFKDVSAHYRFRLPPKASSKIFVTAVADVGQQPATCSYVRTLRAAHRSSRRAENSTAIIESSNSDFDRVLKRSFADLRLLTTETEDGPYPYAGTPWYSTTFGRDALITAFQMLWIDPSMARGVLGRLARFQAKDFDAAADAQPGKILHEMRGGEMAALREIPFGLYYGSVDSTPLFIVLAGAHFEATGDKNFLSEAWPAILRALAWIDGPGDADGDGFVEYARETDRGLSNQGWKDSHDAVFHADGDLARGPIALVEVQGYVYAAKCASARMASALGLSDLARKLSTEAEALQRRFENHFWCEDMGFYALALDGQKTPVRVRSSNAGHMLATGIAAPDHASAVIDELLTGSFFSGWGIRTIATTEARYNPMSYHNGSVWPHDNAMIAAGLARYRHRRRIEPIFNGLLDAALKMDQRRLPELFCGFRRRAGRAPVLYPVACSPQAWASGALFQILHALLGLEIDAPTRTARLQSPFLPERAGSITVRNMRIGSGSADFIVRNRGGILVLDVTASRGGANVILT